MFRNAICCFGANSMVVQIFTLFAANKQPPGCGWQFSKVFQHF